MSLELEDAKKKVAEFQKQCEEYLVIIVQQKREADEQQKVPPPPSPAPRAPYTPHPLGRGFPVSTGYRAGNGSSTSHVFFSFLFLLPPAPSPPLLLKVKSKPSFSFYP